MDIIGQKDAMVLLIANGEYREHHKALVARLRRDNPDAAIDEFEGIMAAMMALGISKYRLLVVVEATSFIKSPLQAISSYFRRCGRELDDAFAWSVADPLPVDFGDPVRVFGRDQMDELAAAVSGRLAELAKTR